MVCKALAIALVLCTVGVASGAGASTGLMKALDKHVERALQKKKPSKKDALVRALLVRDFSAEALDAALAPKAVGAAKKLVGGWMPLHVAAHRGAHQAVGALLAGAKGAAAARELCLQKDGMGLLPLHLAQLGGHKEAQYLLTAAMGAAATNEAMQRTHKLLREVVIGGYGADVTHLVEAGADVGTASSTGWTALHLAAYQGDVALTRLLLGKGAKLDAKDEKGLTPLELAQLGGYKPLVALLREEAAARGVETDSAALGLMFLESVKLAVAKGDMKTMGNLIGAGVDVNTRQEKTEWTGLHICAKSPASVEVMKVLVANGADPNLKDGKGYTALEVAQLDGHAAVVEYLTEHTSASQDAGVARAMLMEAVQYAIRPLKAGGKPDQQTRWLEKAKNLIRTGAAGVVNEARDEAKRWTALHWATLANHVELVTFLLAHGADANLADGDGFVPLTLAQLSGHYELADALRPATTVETAPLVDRLFLDAFKFAIKEGQEIKMKNLLDVGGANPDTRDAERGWAALHMASAAGKLELVKLLLEKGAAVDVRDAKEFTPLMFAAAGGHLKLVRLLVDAGADIALEQADGKTARDLADTKERDEVIEYLDEIKADLDAMADEL